MLLCHIGIRSYSLIAVLVGIALCLAARGDEAPAPAEAVPEADPLAAEISKHLQALEAAVRFEKSTEELGLALHIFPDAREYEILTRAAEEMARGKSAEETATLLAQDVDFQKQLSKLSKLAGFRLDFIQPRNAADTAIRTRQAVHFFNAKLQEAVLFKIDGTAIAWKTWRTPVGMEVKIVRVGRHWTSKRRRLVPQISPLKPEFARVVLRGERASIWGTVPAFALDKKKGVVEAGLENLDRFIGYYTDEHIIDLNEESHAFTQLLSAKTSGELPLVFPPLPARLEAFVASVVAKGTPAEGRTAPAN